MTPQSQTAPLRAHWSLDPSITFLNHGSFGACPTVVLEAQNTWRAMMEKEPVHFFLRVLPDAIDAARYELATFLGCDSDDLAFVSNATTGVNTVIRSLPFEPGDEVIITNQTYGACRNAALYVAERFGVVLKVAQVPFPIGAAQEAVDAVMAEVTEHTKLALIDQVISPTALVLPVAELVQRLAAKGVDTLVDAAHGPGMVDLALHKVEAAYTTGNCHKWLCAPKGAAFLHVRRDKQAAIRPLCISHGASLPLLDKSRFRLEFDWTGTADPSAFLCIPEVLSTMSRFIDGGWNAIRARNRALALEARAIFESVCGLRPSCPDDMVASMAAWPIPPSAWPPEGNAIDPLQERLFRAHKIEVPVFPWPQLDMRILRVSAQLYNTSSDYTRLADVLRTTDALNGPLGTASDDEP